MCYETWDIILSVSTVLASAVAIYISLRISHKQNRIALFEKRYELYNLGINFFESAYNYFYKDDRMSITPMQLVELEAQIDVAIEKSKFLFDEDISNTLSQGKKCFSCNIKAFKANEIDEQQHSAIKQNIIDAKEDFIVKASRYLKL